MKKIVIIGNGISGVTAARHIRKYSSENEIYLISAESEHFFSRTALMYVYMGHMKYEHIKPYEDHFWEKNRIQLINDYVEKVDAAESILKLRSGKSLTFDELIIASGSISSTFGWKGQDLEGVQGFYNLQDLNKLQETTVNVKKAVIVGGGLIGVEVAEMLHSRDIEVTFLIRESSYWNNVLPYEESELINQHLFSFGINLKFETELEEIFGDEKGHARGIRTKNGEELDCELVILATGVRPNINFLEDSDIKCNRGVLVDDCLRTNIPNIYAIGDCAEFVKHPTGRRNIEQVWYTGKMMGETVAYSICKDIISYRPGVWFNSAKLFEIEYQTYGTVNTSPLDGERSLYWESEDQKSCLRLIFDNKEKYLIGVNTLGIRLRHQLIDQWIVEKSSISQVVSQLKDANFDPEFYKINWKRIKKNFESQLNEKVRA